MENFIDEDAIEPSNLEEYAALLQDKVKASLHLVDALRRKTSEGVKRGPVKKLDEDSANDSSQGPLIMNL